VHGWHTSLACFVDNPSQSRVQLCVRDVTSVCLVIRHNEIALLIPFDAFALRAELLAELAKIIYGDDQSASSCLAQLTCFDAVARCVRSIWIRLLCTRFVLRRIADC
jgi:hypothetical protein